MVREVQLTKNKIALVDDADFAAVSEHKWQAKFRRGRWYAEGEVNGKMMAMHRFLLMSPAGSQGDHRDGNGLNNVRSNLRHATHVQNMWNRRKHSNCASGYKGVMQSRSGRWQANIRRGGKRVYLGVFGTPEDAALAYDRAARESHGEFCCVNFPLPGERSAR